MSMLPRFVMGVDPGKRTGIAIVDMLHETCTGVEIGYERVGFELERLIDGLRPAVAVENFVINSATVKNTQAPWSLQVIGITEYLATKYNSKCTRVMQSSAKRFSTNERLERLGWYVPGKGHLVDGERVALLHIVDLGWWHPALDEGIPGTIDATDQEG